MIRVSFPRHAAVLSVVLACAGVGCRSSTEASEASRQPDSGSGVLLAGDFQRVVKPATGHAAIERDADGYELRLNGVGVTSARPVRVYLVGSERADTTRVVVETELKYDMAELDQGAAEQLIALPSAPDPKLRSVVLYDALFGINLAYAALKPPEGAAP
jgi:hypothetical protein